MKSTPKHAPSATLWNRFCQWIDRAIARIGALLIPAPATVPVAIPVKVRP